MFAVTAGIGVDKKEKYFLDDLDDYSAIMLKALADRLAEAFAEALHERVRKDLWGYAADEALTNEELIAEKYRGIRPAPGYPACPDHSVKARHVRAAAGAGDRHGLTEALAMTPAASVSGFYLSHPGQPRTSTSARSATTSCRTRRRGAALSEARAAAAAGAELVGVKGALRPSGGRCVLLKI